MIVDLKWGVNKSGFLRKMSQAGWNFSSEVQPVHSTSRGNPSIKGRKEEMVMRCGFMVLYHHYHHLKKCILLDILFTWYLRLPLCSAGRMSCSWAKGALEGSRAQMILWSCSKHFSHFPANKAQIHALKLLLKYMLYNFILKWIWI